MTVCVVSDSVLANVFQTKRQSVHFSINFVCAYNLLIDRTASSATDGAAVMMCGSILHNSTLFYLNYLNCTLLK